MTYSEEGLEEEQMSNLGCESVSDLIEEVKRLRKKLRECCEHMNYSHNMHGDYCLDCGYKEGDEQ